MSLPGACPDTGQWRRLLLGEAVGDDAAALERHLEACAACRAVLHHLRSGDFKLDGHAGLGEICERFQRAAAGAGDETHSGEHTAAGDPELFAFLDPPQQPDELGRVGRFRVIEVLGRGGMGVVFRAEGPGYEQPVALKVIRSGLALTASARRRFQREAEAAATVSHEFIVPVFEIGEDRGLPYLVMPLLIGETMEDRLRREGRLTVAELIRAGRHIAAGLTAAHGVGLVHRDIKPANVWLEAPVFRARLLDFGLVRVDHDHEPHARIGEVTGTPAYMSPEQAQGEEVDHRADLFSLGCLLYRAGTGKAPFDGNDAAMVLLAVVRDEPPPAIEFNPLLPRVLSDLVMRLLAKDPAERPTSACTVAAQLAALDGVEPPQAPRPPRSVLQRLAALIARRR